MLGQFEPLVIDFLVQRQSRVGLSQRDLLLILFDGDLALQRKFRLGIQPNGNREWFRAVPIVKFVVDGQGLLQVKISTSFFAATLSHCDLEMADWKRKPSKPNPGQC